MKTSRILAALLLAAALAGPAAFAASGSDPLALVPAGAASVAVIHLDQLRASPISARLFTDADKMTADGDAARFMAEADLSPKKDVDLVVVAGMRASSSGDTPVLAIFQGRFDPDRLAAAVESRGGTRKSSPGGDYELLPEKGSKPPAAAAFVSRDLVIAGTESVVVDALGARRSGTVGLNSSSNLGRYLGRVDRGAAAWAIVDVQRFTGQANHAFDEISFTIPRRWFENYDLLTPGITPEWNVPVGERHASVVTDAAHDEVIADE